MARWSHLCAVAAGLAVLLPAGPAAAWGELGHRVSALIAYHRLTPTARARVERLLTQGKDDYAEPDFVGSSLWADRVRFDEPDTAGWHFAAYPLEWAGGYAQCPPQARALRAAKGPRGFALIGGGDCIVSKLAQFSQQLGPSQTDPRALRFLIHLTADLHQPLHVADNKDSGANCVKVASPSGVADTDLHAYWDVAVVRALGTRDEDIAKRLEAQITPAAADAWVTSARTAATPAEMFGAWAKETHDLAPRTYPDKPIPGCRSVGRLPAGYERAAQTIAAMQLEKSGVRLAFLLNRLFDPRVDPRTLRP